MNATVLKDIIVSEWIDCVMECATDLCCRSINFKKTMTLNNESNCEMLHHVAYNNFEELLESNFYYDYAYLVNPQKVRILKIRNKSKTYSERIHLVKYKKRLKL